MTSRILRGAAVAAAAALLLTGCASSDPLAEQYNSGTDANYISGSGVVEEFAAENRTEPVVFGGETDTGGTWSSDDQLGSVVVVNFWYADCPPCRAEARDLQEIYAEFEPQGATFVGVNVRNQGPTALAFAEEFGVTYPSILDAETSEVQLAFAGAIAPNAVPTTLVLDKEGRIAARITGQVTEPSILRTLVSDAVAEGA
jgi:peroxiredoxin